MISLSKEKVRFYKDLNNSLNKQATEKNIEEKLKKISKQSLINLYQTILDNCEAKAILVMPSKTFNDNKNELLSTVNEGFEKFSTSPDFQCDYFEDKLTKNTKVFCNESKFDNVSIVQSFNITNMNAKKDITLALLNKILGSSLDSIMIRELRLKKGFYICNSDYSEKNNTASFSLISNFKPQNAGNYGIRDVLNDYKSFIKKLTNGEIDPSQISRAKTSVKADTAFMNNTAEGKLYMLKDYDIKTCKNLYQMIDNITLDDLKQTAEEVLNVNSYIRIDAPKKVLDENKPYLMTVGEINL